MTEISLLYYSGGIVDSTILHDNYQLFTLINDTLYDCIVHHWQRSVESVQS